MLKHVLNDSAVWKKSVTSDDYNSDNLSDGITIKCKIEFAVQNQTDGAKSVKKHPARMYCNEDVELGDVILFKGNKFKIIQITVYEDFDSNPVLKEVFLL